jgi:hypothetical protein
MNTEFIKDLDNDCLIELLSTLESLDETIANKEGEKDE